jgi:two-component sensor histidine kinase
MNEPLAEAASLEFNPTFPAERACSAHMPASQKHSMRCVLRMAGVTAMALFATLSCWALEAPVLLEPGATSTPWPLVTNYRVTLRWNSVHGASRYHVAVRDLENQKLENYVVPAPVSTYEVALIAGHAYRWNVIAMEGTNESPVSETRSFRVADNPVHPVITSVIPSPVPAMDGKQGFVINGEEFRPGCWVILRDKSTTDPPFEFKGPEILFRRSGQLVISPNFTKSEHSWTVEVLNPGGSSSGEFPVSVMTDSRISRRNWWRGHRPWAYGGVIALGIVAGAGRWIISKMRRKERARLLRDLHDSASADIAYLKQLADLTLAQSSTLPPETQASVRELSFAARDSETAIDDLIWAADPQNENLRQLAARLRHRIRERLNPHNVEADFNGWPAPVPDVSINAQVSSQVLYVCNEVLNNVIKHAHAKKLLYTLVVKDGSVILGFRDDGRGFQSDAQPAGHHGLNNMQTRAHKFGGVVRCQSTPGKGTEISICLPLRHRPIRQLMKRRS